MAYAASDLIKDALLEIGVVADEEVPTSSQANGGLRKFNQLLESWNIEGLMTYGSNPYVLPLTGNKGVYTLGPGGDIDIPTPTNIQSAFIRDTTQPSTNQLDYPLYVYDDQEWQNVPFKSMTAQWPNYGIWFDYGFPFVRAYLNPIPTGSQYSVVIWVGGQLGQYTLNTVLALPAGYQRALVLNLALDLAPSYGPEAIQIAQTIAGRAKEAKDNIVAQNLQLPTLKIDPSISGRNISLEQFLTGRF